MSSSSPDRRAGLFGLRRVIVVAAVGMAATLLTGCIAPALPPSVLDSGREGIPEEGWHPNLNDAQAANCRSCHKEGPEATTP